MSVANKVRTLLGQRPYMLEALEEDIANQTALSQRVASELELSNLVAVKAAVRRLAEELRKQKKKREQNVLDVLKRSTITMHDGLKVVISDRKLGLDSNVALSLDNTYVYLTDKTSVGAKSSHLLTHEKCGTFIITSPPLIEDTPGVVSFLTSLLAKQGINVIEFVSCYTKTLIIVDRADTSRTYEALSSVTGQA